MNKINFVSLVTLITALPKTIVHAHNDQYFFEKGAIFSQFLHWLVVHQVVFFLLATVLGVVLYRLIRSIRILKLGS